MEDLYHYGIEQLKKKKNDQEIIFVLTFFYHYPLGSFSLHVLTRKISSTIVVPLWRVLFIKITALNAPKPAPLLYLMVTSLDQTECVFVFIVLYL